MRAYAQILSLVLIVAAIGGCSTPDKLDLGYEEPPPLLQLDRDIPIIYDSRLTPLPLHSKQYAAITKCAGDFVPEGQRIWFLLVTANHRFTGDRYGFDFRSGRVHVYFTPESVSPRLRKGRCLVLNVHGTDIRNAILGTQPVTYDYGQVSAPDVPFTDALELPGKMLWPAFLFDPPDDEAVVEAADLALALMKGQQMLNGMPIRVTVPIRVHLTPLPIHFITGHPDGRISVVTGTQQDGTAGSGESITFRKQKGEWVVLRIGRWVS